MEDLTQSRDKPPPEEYPPRKVGARGMPLEEGLLQQQERHQRVCEAAGNSSEEYLKNTPKPISSGFGEPHRALSSVEDLAQCRNRPPPEEYPLRKVGDRGIPFVEDLLQ